MPIRIQDPFHDPTTNLREEVNPFVKKLKQGSADGSLPILYGPYLQNVKGGWKQKFAEKSPSHPRALVLEIGSHKGDVLSSMASQHPQTGFIGMDITFKRVVSLAEKAVNDSLPNIISVLCNAQAISQIFGPGELDGVIIFFPDPWANKKRQQKNRLLNQEFLQNLHKVLKPGGSLWFKTDHRPYFEEVSQIADQVLTANYQAKGLFSEVYISHFEKQFKERGLPTYEAYWSKQQL